MLDLLLVLMLGAVAIAAYILAVCLAALPGGLLVTLGERWEHRAVGQPMRVVGMLLVIVGWVAATWAFAVVLNFVPGGDSCAPMVC